MRDPDLQWSRPDEGYPVAIASQNRMPWHTYKFYFQKGNAYLDFSSSIGEHDDTTYYQLGPEFQAAYEAWYAKLNDYLWKTRPDELYSTQGRDGDGMPPRAAGSSRRRTRPTCSTSWTCTRPSAPTGCSSTRLSRPLI